MATISASDAEAKPGADLKAAWRLYMDTLEDIRRQLDESEQYHWDPKQTGMAYRQLMEVQAFAYNYAVGPRTAHPRIFKNTTWQTEFYSIGGNGPDFDYRLTFLDARHEYRLSGRFNGCRFLIAQLNSALPGAPGSRCLANYDFRDFECDADGNFEIIVSAARHPGNWIELDPAGDYQWLMFRPTLETWDATPPLLTIERISALGEDESELDEYNQERVARRITLAAGFVRFVMQDWALGYAPLTLRGAGDWNRFYAFNQVEGGEMGSPAAQYLQCVFAVDEHEALILEFDEEPGVPYWSLQLYDVWQHALAMRTAQTTLHSGQMAKEADGSVRVVLCGRDPGYWNWLDSGNYTRGEVTWRNYLAERNVGHRIKRVPYADLEQHLPSGFRTCTPEQRAAELRQRKAAYLLRHGE
jgi:hypothetical protein